MKIYKTDELSLEFKGKFQLSKTLIAFILGTVLSSGTWWIVVKINMPIQLQPNPNKLVRTEGA